MVCVLFHDFHSPRTLRSQPKECRRFSRNQRKKFPRAQPRKQQYIVEPPFITPIRTAHVVERTRKVDGHTTIEKRIHPYGA